MACFLAIIGLADAPTGACPLGPVEPGEGRGFDRADLASASANGGRKTVIEGAGKGDSDVGEGRLIVDRVGEGSGIDRRKRGGDLGLEGEGVGGV